VRRARIVGDCCFGRLIRGGIAHAKPRQEYGVESQRNSRCENVGKCECQTVVLKLEVLVGAASARLPSWANKFEYPTLVYVLFRLEKN
jgi:hypothetical protein